MSALRKNALALPWLYAWARVHSPADQDVAWLWKMRDYWTTFATGGLGLTDQRWVGWPDLARQSQADLSRRSARERFRKSLAQADAQEWKRPREMAPSLALRRLFLVAPPQRVSDQPAFV